MVSKLSGFAKFDTDIKFHSQQFCKFLELISSDEKEVEMEVEIQPEEGEEGDPVIEKQVHIQMEVNPEKFARNSEIFSKAFKEGQPPFAGDLENEEYKGILDELRAFNLADHPVEE